MKNLVRTKEVEDIVNPTYDPFEWEDHCDACIFFGDAEKCPFFNLVKDAPDTYWKDIGCDHFWD